MYKHFLWEDLPRWKHHLLLYWDEPSFSSDFLPRWSWLKFPPLALLINWLQPMLRFQFSAPTRLEKFKFKMINQRQRTIQRKNLSISLPNWLLFTVIRSFSERSKYFNDNFSFDKTSNIADNCAVEISVLTRLSDLRLEIEAAKVSQFKVVFPSMKNIIYYIYYNIL